MNKQDKHAAKVKFFECRGNELWPDVQPQLIAVPLYSHELHAKQLYRRLVTLEFPQFPLSAVRAVRVEVSIKPYKL